MIGAIRNNHRRSQLEGKANEHASGSPQGQLKHSKTSQIAVKSLLPCQGRVRRWYLNDKIQLCVAAVILFNFLMSVVKLEVSAAGKKSSQATMDAFQYIEYALTCIFFVELLINMYGSFLKPFWKSPWNVFDFLVVCISVLAIVVPGLPAMNALRLFRAFRVMRLFKRIGSMRLILAGISNSITAVLTPLFLLIMVMGVWSIMGVSFFAEDFPALYGDFSKAMLTNFQITTYDQWASGVARPVILKKGGAYSIYFLSYLFVSSIVIMNVIVAVLLDKYLAGSMETDEEDDAVVKAQSEAQGTGLTSEPATWAARSSMMGNRLACPCCGHHFDATPEHVVETKQVTLTVAPVQAVVPHAVDPPIKPADQKIGKKDEKVEKAFNDKYTRGGKQPQKDSEDKNAKQMDRKDSEYNNNMVQPFNNSTSPTPVQLKEESAEWDKREDEQEDDLFSEDGDKEEDEGLNFAAIDEANARLNEAFDRVEALITPHDAVSQKLLKEMKDQVYQEKVNAQRRRAKEAEVSAMKRLAIKFHNNTSTQIFFAGLIFANFAISAVEAQIQPLTPKEKDIFEIFELFFTVVFAAELLINMYANFFCKFWRSAWNWFDFLVVMISLISLGISNMPGITVLRLFRAFRVFRLLKRIPSLRKIVIGVAHALPGVASAFMLLGLVMGIWSILGVGFFKDEFPDHYGDFFKAMLTMFQIMTFDGWASEVTRPILLKEGGVYALYFMSYVFIASIFMANVIIAILLDKYLSATSDVKIKMDDTRESLNKLENDLRGRFSLMEEKLMSNNLKYAFHSMSPLERKLALQSVHLELGGTPNAPFQ